jgi:hypothetical protein
MDDVRMAALQRKARTIGLSDPEADELGRMFAESEGKPYSDAEQEHRAAKATEEKVRKQRIRALRRQRQRQVVERRWFSRGRSLEIGQTAAPPEDTERQEEPHQLARR